MATFIHTYEHIISLENLLEAWKEFVCGKRSRKDVQEFERDLMSNILVLNSELSQNIYRHSAYESFNISDPKPRNIHKASVRDRLLHHAIYRILYPFFDHIFIRDSYSCRIHKGTHKALDTFKYFAQDASNNHKKTLWVLKCDIKKFFASIDQKILLSILSSQITDKNILELLRDIISSFHSSESGKGLPLGNLTSQLLVNIYMNELDQWMKNVMKAKYYIRYADDFVIMSQDKAYLLELTTKIADFLEDKLMLTLHPDKVFIKTIASGVDFLGWVHFPHHRVLRTATKKRMMRNIQTNFSEAGKQSYKGMLSHGNAYKLEQKLL